ncbi:epidermal growth factor receptor-like [Littorina saxatilis]|uniref:receptor protein-tyrosine kinase n=2 Tax=Littorina saxatilis TaxID=31220 RepID=A0AAN9BU66_9CAEN
MVHFSALFVIVFATVLLVNCDLIPTLFQEQMKECHVWTTTFYENPNFHYNNLRRQYDGCTHVMGNLVIADLSSYDIEYDLSFLRSIRYVSGHVAIYANVNPAVVPLTRLEVIRGNTSFRDDPAVHGVSDITLLIAVNNHRQVLMPKLKEVSSGNVLIDFNTSPDLCYLDTIDWSHIVREGTVHMSSNSATCPPCSRACDLAASWRGHCWGRADFRCQRPSGPIQCAEECNDRCSYKDPSVCCHDQCAVGCTGPSPRQCMLCKDYQLQDGSCVSHCPYEPWTNPRGQNCIPLE